MDQPSVAEAVKQICEEKGIAFEAVIEIIEAALAAAYRKDFGQPNQNHRAIFNAETGALEIYDVKTVVDDVDLEAEQVAWEEYRVKLVGLGFAIQTEATIGISLPVAPATGVPPTPENLAAAGLEPFKRFDPRKEIMAQTKIMTKLMQRSLENIGWSNFFRTIF